VGQDRLLINLSWNAVIKKEKENVVDNIGRISGLVVTGFRQSRGWESHSHPVGSSSDRVDIQRGHWASFSLGQALVQHRCRGTNVMSDQVVVLKTFNNEIEAGMAQQVLQEAGMQAFVFKDDAGGMEPQLQQTNGVRLVVSRVDARRAHKLLKT
jgi:hypothetical protein